MFNNSKSFIYKIGYPIAKVYWFFTRPVTNGVRCVILYQDQILLIRHTYGSQLLNTVGGGVHKNESLEEAVMREVHEEVGLCLASIQKVGEVKYNEEYKDDTIHVFYSVVNSNILKIDKAEIKEADWYHIDDLPDNVSPLFKIFYDLAKTQIKTID